MTKVIGSGARAYSLALQVREGKVTLAGRVGFDFAFARYTATGTLDTTLDDGSSHAGYVLTDMGGTDIARAIAYQADGKLVVAGTSSSSFAVARYEMPQTAYRSRRLDEGISEIFAPSFSGSI